MLDVVHSQIKLKVLHTVVMFDELATEKRIRRDPKTNFFVGVCRQHASRTLMEFINDGDMEELFQCLDDGGGGERVPSWVKFTSVSRID